MDSFTFIDLFSGIGGFRIPIEELGGKSLGFSEIDKTAIQTYKKNFLTQKEEEFGDITKIQALPKVDLLVGGVPCQSWSVAGQKKGFNDPRGKLWFDTIRLTKQSKPKVFIYENVKGLADPRNKENLELIINEFSNLNYKVFYKVLNAFNFGQPQNRERIFIIGIQKNLIKKNNYKFPSNFNYLPRLASVINYNETRKHQNIKIKKNESINSFNLSYKYNKENFFTFCDTRNGENTIHSWDLKNCTDKEKKICMLILKNRRKSKYGDKDGNPLSLKQLQELQKTITQSDLEKLCQKEILKKVKKKYEFVNSKNSSGINGIYRIFLPSSIVFSTLTRTGSRDYIATQDIPKHVEDRKKYFLKEIYKKNNFRKPTITESLKIQGFPDSFSFPVNDHKARQLIGNAVPINIVKELILSIKNYI